MVKENALGGLFLEHQLRVKLQQITFRNKTDVAVEIGNHWHREYGVTESGVKRFVKKVIQLVTNLCEINLEVVRKNNAYEKDKIEENGLLCN